MKRLLFFFLLVLAPLTAQTYQPTWDSIDKRPTPDWFTEAKFGIFIHWGIYSAPAYAPVIPGKLAYAEWYWHQMNEGRDNPRPTRWRPAPGPTTRRRYGADYAYQGFVRSSRRRLFDPDQWAAIFEGSGAKYVVLTSKHHEGFALWPSKEASATWGRPWNAVEAGPKRDVLGDLSAAVRRKGLRMGYYYSLYEWYNPLWLNDKPRYVRDHMTPPVQGPGHEIQAVHHLHRRRVGDSIERLAQSRAAGLALQRIPGQG